mmetsp:Transcript_14805/g.2473  ORF Transcript_14805/g.2473 Transcript_14805/m.2473 type:complete len:119 (+) Transcript_14805:1236-1592(+)
MMEFKRCSIKGKQYGSLEPQETSEQISYYPHSKFKFFDPKLLKDLKKGNNDVKEFLECLSLCHTVIPEKADESELAYQAASPDEEALVIAAHGLGYSFVNAHATYYSLDILGERAEFK